jgi:phytoene dehydrogenase-like protein
MARRRFDAIVVGGGHNGLVHAAYLARAGWSVLVLEKRSMVGGAAVTEEVFPGFHFPVASYLVSLLRPEIIRELELARHGLELLPLLGTFTPIDDTRYLWRPGDSEADRREIGRHSTRDAERYGEFGEAMVRMARAVQPLLDLTPPDPGEPGIGDLLRGLTAARHLTGLSGTDRYELVRLMTTSALDLVDRWFETDSLRATLAASGIIGTFQGIRTPGTAYVLLHHYMGEVGGVVRSWGLPRGGTGAVSEAICSAARELGAEVRTDTAVEEILVRNGEAVGVRLADGSSVAAGVVSSGLDPRRTFLGLVGRDQLPDDFVAALEHYRFRGSSAKVNLALDGLPDFSALPGTGPHLKGAISISPGVAYMDQAYADAVAGDFSERPYLDIVIPSLTDPTIAPPGRHVMSCFVQYAPYRLARGTWDERRDELGRRVLDTLADYAPGIRDRVIHMQVVTQRSDL